MFFTSGCCTYIVFKNSEEKIARRRNVENNQDKVGLYEIIKEQPYLQLGALLADATIIKRLEVEFLLKIVLK